MCIKLVVSTNMFICCESSLSSVRLLTANPSFLPRMNESRALLLSQSFNCRAYIRTIINKPFTTSSLLTFNLPPPSHRPSLPSFSPASQIVSHDRFQSSSFTSWRSGRVVKAFDSNHWTCFNQQISNPFGGVCSNHTGVAIFCPFCTYLMLV